MLKLVLIKVTLSNVLSFQRPLELGADISVYSAGKYMNGHSDVTMGAVSTNDQVIGQKLQFQQVR